MGILPPHTYFPQLIGVSEQSPQKDDLASLYFWNSMVLEKAGKEQESKLAKEKALSIDPECRGYYRVWH